MRFSNIFKSKSKQTITLISISVIISFFCIAPILEKLYIDGFLGMSYTPNSYIFISASNYFRYMLFFLVSLFLLLHLVLDVENIYNWIYKYRFKIAAVIFALCVIFEVHGSSISMWNHYIDSSSNNSIYKNPVFGVERPVRSDEWNVFTPLAMSQRFTDYSITSNIARATDTDMLTVYNQPVKDITAIAKPFYWGYLLFGSAKGLSWFWVGRLIALFVVSFEFFMIITKEHKIYSLAGAFLVAFAPVVQWWFAINFFVEMLIYGQLAIIMVNKFLNTGKKKKRIVYTTVFAMCGIGFAFSLYPAWMIPLLYLFGVIFIWVVLENKNKIKKNDIQYLFFAMCGIGTIMVFWIMRSKETFDTMLNTNYPGSSSYTGGGGISLLSYYVVNIIEPFDGTGNPCETAGFLGFFPITEIVTIIYLLKNKFKDKLIVYLFVLDIVFITLIAVGWSPMIAKITLLSFSSQRIMPIILLIEVMIYIKILSTGMTLMQNSQLKSIWIWVGTVMLGIVFVSVAPYNIPVHIAPTGGLPKWYIFGFTALMISFTTMFFIKKNKGMDIKICATLIMITFVPGIVVNPIMRTTDVIYKNDFSETVQIIQKENPGIWISKNAIISNFLIMQGIPTINSTNILPANERWKQLDQIGQYEDIYNRYAHIDVEFIVDETFFEYGEAVDRFVLNLNKDNFETLSIKYVCVPVDFVMPQDWEDVDAKEIYSDKRNKIIKVG